MAHRLAVLLPALLLGSCAAPTFPPPRQYDFTAPSPIGSFVNMIYEDADSYVVRDVPPNAVTKSWRWAGAHPQLRFFIEAPNGVTFSADYACAETLFRQTGPVTLTFLINDRKFGQTNCSHSGRAQFSIKVPSGLLIPGAINLLRIEPDKTAAGEDGTVLGFILISAGFLS